MHVHVASLGASLSTGCPPPRTAASGRPGDRLQRVDLSAPSSADRIALLPAAEALIIYLIFFCTFNLII